MSDYKEFTGKTLDEAIQAACSHFSMERGKLEIEIESGGSTGIFGLVGVKKASIKARPRGKFAPLDNKGDGKAEGKPERKSKPRREPKPAAKAEPKSTDEPSDEPSDEKTAAQAPEQAAAPDQDAPNQDASGQDTPGQDAEAKAERPKPKRKPRGRRSGKDDQDAKDQIQNADQEGQTADADQADAPKGEGRSRSRRSRGRGRRGGERKTGEHKAEETKNGNKRGRSGGRRKPERQADADFGNGLDDDLQPDIDGNRVRPDRPQKEMASLDKNALESCVRQVVARLVGDLVQAPQLSVRVEKDKVLVFIEDEENSGLIIGREGQTLSALQYLTTRIVSREMDAAVRVQLDTGDYRERQNDKLKDMAHQLAAKSISTGKVQSTRPLSSYHRRVVHLALQNAAGVTTRSKGEGPTKRVLILPKKNG